MAIKITITFMSGNQKIVQTDIPPSVKEDVLYVKNRGGEDTGGGFGHMRNIRWVDVAPIKESDKNQS